MKISYDYLQSFFADPLPGIGAVSDAFTFHSFEIENVEENVLDIKVLPNRINDCGNEIGIARQLSAILNLPLKQEFEIPSKQGTTLIQTSLTEINSILGADFSEHEVEDVFRRLHINAVKEAGNYKLTPVLERVDLTLPPDIAEEVVQILGYDRIPAIELPPLSEKPDQARYQAIERIKDELVQQGFVEVSTQSFAAMGDLELANPLDKTKPYLRTSLKENLESALGRAKQYAPLVLAPNERPKLFEVGTVFPGTGEFLELRTTESLFSYKNLSLEKLEEYGKGYSPQQHFLGSYKAFSVYPFVIRDIAVWVPIKTDVENLYSEIVTTATDLCRTLTLFDRFEKGDQVSLAFRLVFQSLERTLTDEEVGEIMKTIERELKNKGYTVR